MSTVTPDKKDKAPPAQIAMGRWKIHKLKKKGRGSQATGRSKGLRPSALQKYMCRRNRSYKDPLYGEVMADLGKRKVKK